MPNVRDDVNFFDIADQVANLLQRRRRVTYCALKYQFKLDDADLATLKDELIYAQQLARDEDGRVLVCWDDTQSAISGAPKTPPSEPVEERCLYGVLPLVIGVLQRERRLTYRSLAHLFGLSPMLMQDVRDELLFKKLAYDEHGKGLVWIDQGHSLAPAMSATALTVAPETSASGITNPDRGVVTEPAPVREAATSVSRAATLEPPPSEPPSAELAGERRQVTIVFADISGFTAMSKLMDPETVRNLLNACLGELVPVVNRYGGTIDKFIGDAIMALFGAPIAHENDPERAVRAALDMMAALEGFNAQHETDLGLHCGINTGVVIAGNLGTASKQAYSVIGDAVNLAARLEDASERGEIFVGPETYRLTQDKFDFELLEPMRLKGKAEPVPVYQVKGLRESEWLREEDFHLGFDNLLGRDEEIGLLLRRWEQSKEGQGQVVLVNGEAGMGKSSLIEGLRRHVDQEGYAHITFRASPYTTNSVLHPVINYVQQTLGWQREDAAETRLAKLEQVLADFHVPLEESVPLLAALFSLSLPQDRYAPLALAPLQQRQQTHDMLVAWILEQAERQPLLAVWEDLHWADPSTLEVLGLLMDQSPTVHLMNVLAFRPVFVPLWPSQSHLTPITLSRLERLHIEALATRLADGKALPVEVMAHVVSKTDGVPLYVEELTKMLLESELLEKEAEAYVLTGPFASASIPATLQDSLMARLDQLDQAKEIAQLGAVVGRQFAYPMIQALLGLEETELQAGLSQLVTSELLYQRGRPPRSQYIFKHALIQDAAYASLLNSKREQVHHQVAQLFETQFSEVIETYPELVAHHFTEGNQFEAAVRYWQLAGQQARQRSANTEAISHLTHGLALLAQLPHTPEHDQQELDMHMTLGPALIATKGHGAPDVASAYRRAQALCDQLDDASQRFSVLMGLYLYYLNAGLLQIALDLSAQLLHLAQDQTDPAGLQAAHLAMGQSHFYHGDLQEAHTHLEHSLASRTLHTVVHRPIQARNQG